MSRQVPNDRALSDEDRQYLLTHGEDLLVAQFDARFPEGAPAEDPAEEEDADVLPYEEWSAEDLRAELGERKLAKTGNKQEMAARLREHDAQTEE